MPPAIPFVPAIIGAATSVAGGMMAKKAAGKAAKQANAGAAAGLAEQRKMFEEAKVRNQPYSKMGLDSVAQMQQLLGQTEGGGANQGLLTRNFGQGDLDSDVVYNTGLKFGLDQGNQAINRRARSQGAYDSGATLKALARYANDYGSTKAADAEGRWQANRNYIGNNVGGGIGVGQQANQSLDSLGSAMGNNASGTANQIAGNNAAKTVANSNSNINMFSGVMDAFSPAISKGFLGKNVGKG